MAYSYKVWISWGWVDFGVAYGWSHICSLGKHIKSGWNSFAQFSKWVVVQGFVFGVNGCGDFKDTFPNLYCVARDKEIMMVIYIYIMGVFFGM